jgi:hypothetical protein
MGLGISSHAASLPSYRGEIHFTDVEKQSHLAAMPRFIEASNYCLDSSLKSEDAGYIHNKYGLYQYYGDNSVYAKLRTKSQRLTRIIEVLLEEKNKHTFDGMDADENEISNAIEKDLGPRVAAVKQLVSYMLKTGSPTSAARDIETELKASYSIKDASEILELLEGPHALKEESCVGFALICLEYSFRESGQKDLWHKIITYTKANGLEGTALQNALRELGWQVLFWNADPSLNKKWDEYEFKGNTKADPEKEDGYHEYVWQRIQSEAKNHLPVYYGINRVDDWTTLVGFKTTPPESFTKIPFFVGSAHFGHHVFVGMSGQMIEAHNDFSVESALISLSEPYFPFEEREFNPLKKGDYFADDFDIGSPERPQSPENTNEPVQGGPRGEFFSGLIAVPPGFLPQH